MALGNAPTVLNPAHETPNEPADKHANDNAAKDITWIVNTQIYAAVALQQCPSE